MRPVAALLPLLVLVSGLPAGQAADECVDPCQFTTVPLPTGARGFYVYAQATSCVPPNGGCSGNPPARVIGIVYEETNGVPGLQRKAGLDHGPDKNHVL